MSDFHVARLEESYSHIGELSPLLLDAIMATRTGALEEVASVAERWRRALLEGGLPELPLGWPEEAVQRAVHEELSRLDLARLCVDQPERADELVASILGALDVGACAFEALASELLEELARLCRERLREVPALEEPPEVLDPIELFERIEALPRDEPGVEAFVEVTAEQLEDRMEQARQRALGPSVDALGEQWAVRAEAWHELMVLLGDLSGLLGRGWDWSVGALGRSGWMELEQLAALLERLPEWREVVEQLGRLRDSEEHGQSMREIIFERVVDSHLEERRVRVDRVPAETRGITLSNHLSRQLPSEMVQMSHPLLGKYWMSRWLEHRLMTYRVSAEEIERIESEQASDQPRERPAPDVRRMRGPVMVCVDTSGSMHGAPEVVAKALTLEAARTASSQRRRCYLYQFSGPGQVRERDVTLDGDHFLGLLEFFGLSFHGGTDVHEPLSRALERLEASDWARADVLLLSDGRFGVSSDLRERLDRARDEHGLEVHGVLLGATRSEAMSRLCDHLHVFEEWSKLEIESSP